MSTATGRSARRLTSRSSLSLSAIPTCPSSTADLALPIRNKSRHSGIKSSATLCTSGSPPHTPLPTCGRSRSRDILTSPAGPVIGLSVEKATTEIKCTDELNAEAGVGTDVQDGEMGVLLRRPPMSLRGTLFVYADAQVTAGWDTLAAVYREHAAVIALAPKQQRPSEHGCGEREQAAVVSGGVGGAGKGPDEEVLAEEHGCPPAELVAIGSGAQCARTRPWTRL
ncbi:hypothetical protein GY45DRAFT_1375872 [Cubamyces sp. BRFM 1775]|nr:hypothetical protein GY45DRAFT_1375872 [Cubamyces sp. BRFM 1775]